MLQGAHAVCGQEGGGLDLRRQSVARRRGPVGPLVHWKKSPAALFVPVHCATLSLLRASPGWPSWPPVRRSASHPWAAPFGSTSGRPNALLRVCVPTRPWTAPFGSTSGRPNALLRVCRTSASFPLAARPGQKSVVFASCVAGENASPTGSWLGCGNAYFADFSCHTARVSGEP